MSDAPVRHPLSLPLYALAGALVLSSLALSCGSRYEAVSVDGPAYLVDSWTGKARFLVGVTGQDVEPSPSAP
ncbi:hypothetical protein [Rubrivirga marina]|uniref:Uncharacterized protein n=1 Tax=Rubrivirga marina TaxID=1196024 RepID=A0A271J1R3_9BACT|nr:hypothetical protein [Rubrivirga marina]PAP76984.1 hypothetical protein BSZ37_11345 [Rubrivirga marina]